MKVQNLRCILALAAGLFAAVPVHAQTWTGTWTTSPMPTSISTAFNNMTLRQIVHTSIGGTATRVQISNVFGTQPLSISDVHVAQATSPTSDSTVAGTDHQVTFGGSTSVTIPAGGLAISDSVAMTVGASSDIAISIFFPTASMTTGVTYHQFGEQNSWWGSGDVSSSTGMSPIGESNSYYWLTGLDVQNSSATGAVVCLGASITDGYSSTFAANNRWPNDLATRLNSAGDTIGVLNEGISGNTLLAGGSGPTAQSRFQRDVVAQTGVKWVIFADDPINDLTSTNPTPSFSSFQSAYANIISEAHAAGLKIYLATLTPYSNYSGWSSAQETVREQINSWIEGGTTDADGYIDFATPVANPSNPTSIAPAYDFGDGLHPNSAGLQVMANNINLSLFGPAAEGPFGGTPAAVPGTVQAENYDTGGQGVAYSANSVNGTANSYRSDGIDLETTSDTGGGYDLGWTSGAQWFKYTVNVATAGAYTVTFRYAAPSAVTDGFHIMNSSSTNLTGSVNLPATGGWQTWANATASVNLPAGTQTLTVFQDTGGWNLNYMTFASTAPAEGPYGGTPAAIPGTVQAENYDTGGQGVAYNVTSVNGNGTAYRPDGVDLETTADTGGGYDLGWTSNGQWFKYTVNVGTAGAYTVTFRVASDSAVGSSGGTFHLQNSSGTSLTGEVTVPGTDGWQTWENVTANVTLPAGQQVLELFQDTGGYNVNYITFATGSGGGNPPPAPTGLSATSGSGNVALGWTGSTGATSYNVYRGTSSGGESSTAIATGLTSATYTDSAVTGGTAYYYKVAAVDASGASALSNEANATPSTALPDLIVTSISWTPTTLTAGSQVVFSCVVKNQGTGPTPAGVIIGVQFAIDGSESVITWSDTDTTSLAPGASVTLTCDNGTNGVNYWPATAGTHTVQAWVNDVDRFAESNLNNNKLTASITVP